MARLFCLGGTNAKVFVMATSWIHQSSRYELVKEGLTFSNATEAANDIGGYLAEISSAEENESVYSEILIRMDNTDLSNTTAEDGGDSAYVWLGGSDSVTEGVWKWIESETTFSTSRSEWGSGELGQEPDNFEDQDGLALGLENWPYGSSDNRGYGNAGSWNDVDLQNDLFYLVEFNMKAETTRKGAGGDDVIKATNDKDIITGSGGNDDLRGRQGGDYIFGEDGDDLIHGGNGRDFVSGGNGADDIYGGFGHNTFDDERDSSVDYLYFMSDQFAYNWLYESAGNNSSGNKLDIIKGLDQDDRLFVQGVETSDLTFRQVNNFAAPTGNFSGIGIYANGFLEGLYTGGDLTSSQLQSMTTGVDS